MAEPMEYRLDNALHVTTQAAAITRNWRERVFTVLPFKPPSSFYRVLLAMRLTPHTAWTAKDMAVRVSIRSNVVDIIFDRMERARLIVREPDGYKLTDLGRAAAEA